MRIDTMVHGSPRYYWWKLKALKFIKKSAGMVLGVNGQADRLREHIEKANGELIKKYLTNKSVLEVGCGTGGMLSTLEGKCRCTGVDISPAMVEYARHHNPGPDYQVMDGTDLQFADKAFDVVIFRYVLHHVEDVDATLGEAKRVGKQVMILESCACERQPYKWLSQLWWKVTDGGYRYLTLDEWEQRIGWNLLDEIRGAGVVRYGMCIMGEVEKRAVAQTGL